jgi:hypothetical protein
MVGTIRGLKIGVGERQRVSTFRKGSVLSRGSPCLSIVCRLFDVIGYTARRYSRDLPVQISAFAARAHGGRCGNTDGV